MMVAVKPVETTAGRTLNAPMPWGSDQNSSKNRLKGVVLFLLHRCKIETITGLVLHAACPISDRRRITGNAKARYWAGSARIYFTIDRLAGSSRHVAGDFPRNEIARRAGNDGADGNDSEHRGSFR